MKTCNSCKVLLPIENFQKKHGTCRPCRNIKNAEWRKANREWYNNYQKEYQRRERQKVMEAYGNVCQCCGISDPVFLTIDHIYGDGRKDRINGVSGHKTRFYTSIINRGFPEEYQILCWNCNWAKSKDGCPHGNSAGQPKERPAR